MTSVSAATNGQSAWLTAPAEEGLLSQHGRAGIEYSLWSPPGAGDATPLPLLVVNDGPEYDKLASLTQYLAAGVTGITDSLAELLDSGRVTLYCIGAANDHALDRIAARDRRGLAARVRGNPAAARTGDRA